MLSERKANFLQRNSFFSYQLRAAELPRIRDHYEKQGMLIVINGESPFGQSCLGSKQRKLEALQKNLRIPQLKYAVYVIQNWELDVSVPQTNKNSFLLTDVLLPNELESLKKALAGFLTTDNKFKKMSRPELLEMNIICRNELDQSWLEQQICSYHALLKRMQQDVCLEIHECVEEMQLLQSAMSDAKPVGYIYTHNHRHVGGHFEVFIIMPDRIIKPLDWPGMRSQVINEEVLSFYYPCLSLPILRKLSSSPTPCPQAERLECGTLGMMYLKELLKDDAKQLHEFTLQIRFSSAEQQYFFFLPSPQVLRYSQSTRFNKVIAAMLEDEVSVEVTHGAERYEVYTVRTLLEVSLRDAQVKNVPDQVRHLEGVLTDLPRFRDKWLAAYYEMGTKRAMMTKEEKNHYLCYTTKRMEAIKNELVEKKIFRL